MMEVARNRKRRPNSSFVMFIFALFLFACIYLLSMVYYGRFDLYAGDEHFGKYLQSQVSVAEMLRMLVHFGSKVHWASSERDIELADYLARSWKQYGLHKVRKFSYTFPISLANPHKSNRIDVVNASNGFLLWSLSSNTTVNDGETFSFYHAFSRNVSPPVSGWLVFVNRASDDDLLKLEAVANSRFTPCNGSVVLLRLGYTFRSAQLRNLMDYCNRKSWEQPNGVLTYPDPVDFADNQTANVFPQSWWLPADAVRMGHVRMSGTRVDIDISSLRTPNGGYALRDAAPSMLPFPVQPISYGDAKRLLQQLMQKPLCPSDWDGTFTHYCGPIDRFSIRMELFNIIESRSIVNVVGVLPGLSPTLSAQHILFAQHRDAWSYGVSDPLSGTVILDQTVRILSEAYRQGVFRPLRTIVFASWDGEEMGLLGSTSFVEEFRAFLHSHLVAHINMDCPVKGFDTFSLRTDPWLKLVAFEAAKAIEFYDKEQQQMVTLYNSWKHWLPRNESDVNTEPAYRYLGGGSDHIPIAYVLGVPSMYPEWQHHSRLPSMPTYHTTYDNLMYMLKHVDPDLHHHRILAQYMLEVLLRLSRNLFLPYDVPEVLQQISEQLEVLGLEKQDYFRRNNMTLDALIVATNAVVPVWEQFQYRLNNSCFDLLCVSKYNRVIELLPRCFTYHMGVPGRPSFKNILTGIARGNAYQSVMFPGLRNAIARDSLDDVKKHYKALLASINQVHYLLMDVF